MLIRVISQIMKYANLVGAVSLAGCFIYDVSAKPGIAEVIQADQQVLPQLNCR